MSYTPIDPHEYRLEQVILSTQRNNHSVDVTKTLAEIEIFEHIERPYITGTVTFTDNDRIIEIMDFQGCEFCDIKLGLYQSSHNVTRRFVVRELLSVVPSSDTTDVVTLSLIDYDAYYNSLVNVNKTYDGTPGDIIDKILFDSFPNGTKRVIRSQGGVASQARNADLSSEIPEIAARAQAEARQYELQTQMRYIVPNLNPFEAIKILERRATAKNGSPFYCFATFKDNDLRFFDLYTMITTPSLNSSDSFIYSQQMSQGSSQQGADMARSISNMTTSQGENTLKYILNGDIGTLYEYSDPTFQVENFIGYDLQKTIQNLLGQDMYPTVDTRTTFNNKPLSEYRAQRKSRIAPSKIYEGALKNLYDEEDGARHSAKAVAASLRNILTKSTLQITVPGLHTMPQASAHKTIGNVITVLSLAGEDGLADRKRSGDYLVYAARHRFVQERYSADMSLVKLANYRGNTRVGNTTGGQVI
jgi:hypothetical protein